MISWVLSKLFPVYLPEIYDYEGDLDTIGGAELILILILKKRGMK